MEKPSQGYDEKGLEEDHKFIIFFLKDDEDQSVQVEEVEEINFLEVSRHLNLGESVFIAHRKPKIGVENEDEVLNEASVS